MGGSSSKLGWPIVDMSGKTVIVTGANTGIGFETAKHIAIMGAKVILACRTEGKAKAAILRMQADYMEYKAENSSPPSYESAANEDAEEPGLDVEFMPLDLGSLKSVVEFANAYKEKGYPLDILICNAGATFKTFAKTEDSFERQFQTNYLGHFLLTLHLLPVMRRSGDDCRVINVSSMLHSGGKLNLNNMQGEKGYSYSNAYSNSKLFQVMSTFSLDRRLQDTSISVFSLHPGIIDTSLANGLRKESGFVRFQYSLGKSLGIVTSDLTKGAATTINVAVSPHLKELRGSYFSDCVPVTPSLYSKDVKKKKVPTATLR